MLAARRFQRHGLRKCFDFQRERSRRRGGGLSPDGGGRKRETTGCSGGSKNLETTGKAVTSFLRKRETNGTRAIAEKNRERGAGGADVALPRPKNFDVRRNGMAA